MDGQGLAIANMSGQHFWRNNEGNKSESFYIAFPDPFGTLIDPLVIHFQRVKGWQYDAEKTNIGLLCQS